jgi:hypothetical protein
MVRNHNLRANVRIQDTYRTHKAAQFQIWYGYQTNSMNIKVKDIKPYASIPAND